MQERQAKLRERLTELAPQLAFLEAIRAELPEDGILSTKSRKSALLPGWPFRSTSRARSFRRAIRTILAGALRPRSACRTRSRDVPVLSINGDGGFLYTGNELATAVRHQIPLVAMFSMTAPLAMCAASSRNSSATG